MPERVHQATTAHLRAVFPFIAGRGLGTQGIYIGADLDGGGFYYDPWVLYAQGRMPNPNMLVVGDLGGGKTNLIASYCYMQAVLGRWSAFNDPKGDYPPLARALGCEPIHLRPGGGICLNPFAGMNLQAQEGLLVAMAAAVLNKPLQPIEKTACSIAVRDAAARGQEVFLPQIVHALKWPAEDVGKQVGLGVTQQHVADAGRSVALELQNFCPGGVLAGMFDGPTSPGVHTDGLCVDLVLKDIYEKHRDALRLVMIMADGFLEVLTAKRGRGVRANDEGWALYRDLRVAQSMQSSYKLARATGQQNVLIMHGLSDVDAAGDADSQERALARGLIRDSGTVVIYKQSPGEAKVTAGVLGLTRAQLHMIPRLSQGTAIWRVGEQPFVVRHVRSAFEAEAFSTDKAMLGQDVVERLRDEAEAAEAEAEVRNRVQAIAEQGQQSAEDEGVA